MPIPISKDELIFAIKKDSTRLLDAFGKLSDSDWASYNIQGNSKGTLITPANLLAYQIGWGLLLLSWYKKGLDAAQFDMPLEGFKWNELGKLAAYFHQQYEGANPAQLQEKFKEMLDQVLALTQSLSNEQLYTVGIYSWTGRYTLGRYIQLNTASPYKNALIKLRKFSKNR